MSYRICYHPGPVKKPAKDPDRLQIPVVALMIMISALIMTWVLPVQTAKLRETLFPWTQAQMQEAIGCFREEIASGESFKDSVTAFCKEILDEASK